VRAVHDQLVKLFESAFVEQEFDPLARGHFAGGVLLFNPSRPAALFRLSRALFENFEF
jgi:hypothetical protein